MVRGLEGWWSWCEGWFGGLVRIGMYCVMYMEKVRKKIPSRRMIGVLILKKSRWIVRAYERKNLFITIRYVS